VSEPTKATLTVLKPGTDDGPDAFDVQFNPSSLRFVSSQQAPARPPTGPPEPSTGSSSTLTLDLHFDTADEGTTAAPVDVRRRTAQVLQFVLPQKINGKNQAPPRVRFQWAKLVAIGVMTQANEDLDLFSATGVPLRAKVAVTILIQDPLVAIDPVKSKTPGGGGAGMAVGAGAEIGFGASVGVSASFGASIGGGASIGLPQLSIGGSVGASVSVAAGVGMSASFGTAKVGVALDGESPAAFAARNGLDPAAWRALATPRGIELSLEAGTEVAFPTGAGAAPGVGSASGASQPTGIAALAHIDGPATTALPRSAIATGFALARAGGVDAAVQTTRQERADSATGRELEAFGLQAPARAPLSVQRIPLNVLGAAASAAPGPAPPRADERATSFGAGVPLRPRRALPHAGGAERVVLGRRAPAIAAAPPMPPSHGGDCGCGCWGAR
jgi:hypothetical protein